MINRDIGKRIKERRKELGISAVELAEQLNFTKATIYRYESGEIKALKLPVIEKIAEILNCNPLWLIGKSDDKYEVNKAHKINRLDIDYDKIENNNIAYSTNSDSYDLAIVLDNIVLDLMDDKNITFEGKPVSTNDKRLLIKNIESTLEEMLKHKN